MLKTTTARLLALCTVTALASGCVALPDDGYYDAPAYPTRTYPQTYPSGPVYAPGVIYGPGAYPVARPLYDGRRIDRERWQRERERDAQRDRLQRERERDAQRERERDRVQRERDAQRDRDRAQRDHDTRQNAQRNEQVRQQQEREKAYRREQLKQQSKEDHLRRNREEFGDQRFGNVPPQHQGK